MRGREEPDPGAGPVPAGAADDAGHARAAHPRLRPARHHQLVRRVQHRRRLGHQRAAPPSPGVEFKKFLARIDKAVPADLDVHLVCDNYATHKTPAIRAWLARHPRFHVHFTPTGSSWMNQVERCSPAHRQADPPRRPHLRQALEDDIRELDRRLERQPPAVHLDQNRRRDPEFPRRLLTTLERRRTLELNAFSGGDTSKRSPRPVTGTAAGPGRPGRRPPRPRSSCGSPRPRSA